MLYQSLEMTTNVNSKELLKLESCLVSKEEHLKRLFTNNKLGEKGTTFKLEPSSALDKVKNFIPILKQANSEVEKAVKNGEDVDIETIDQNYNGKLIEMDFALFYDGSSSDCSSDDDSEDDENGESKLVTEFEPIKKETDTK